MKTSRYEYHCQLAEDIARATPGITESIVTSMIRLMEIQWEEQLLFLKALMDVEVLAAPHGGIGVLEDIESIYPPAAAAMNHYRKAVTDRKIAKEQYNVLIAAAKTKSLEEFMVAARTISNSR